MSSSKKIILRSYDGETFEVEELVAIEWLGVKPLVEGCSNDKSIPLPNVTSKILAKIIKYCKKHGETANFEDPVVNEEIRSWDAGFVKVV